MTESATNLQRAAVRVRVARRVREYAQRDVDALQGQLEAAQDSLRAARREEQQANSALTSTALDATEDEHQEALWALPEHRPAPAQAGGAL